MPSLLKVIFPLVLTVLPAATLADVLSVNSVAPGIWAIEGPAEQRDLENLGNNATFGLIETNEGAVLVDPGGTWAGAAMLHDVVRGLTDQPLVYVINTGGQDHRWLGNGYWKEQGAIVIASESAVADHKDRGSLQLSVLSQLVGDGLNGTTPVNADVTFDTEHVMTLGERRIEVRHVGAAHTPGDSFVWLPQDSTVLQHGIQGRHRLHRSYPWSDAIF